MSFSLEITTADQKSEQELLSTMSKAKQECKRRIVAVANETTQLNLAAAAGAGVLTEEQRLAYISGVQWITTMRSIWPQLVLEEKDISEDSNWPEVPEAVYSLVKAY